MTLTTESKLLFYHSSNQGTWTGEEFRSYDFIMLPSKSKQKESKTKVKGESSSLSNNQEKKKKKKSHDEFQSLNLEELEQTVRKLQENVEMATVERIQAQVEYETLQSFFDVNRTNLMDTKSQIQVIRQKIEEREETHATELQVYGNKVKHFQYNHHLKLRQEEELKSKMSHLIHQTHENDLENMTRDTDAIQEELHERDLLHDKELEELQRKYEREIELLQSRLSTELEQCQNTCKRNLDELTEELTIKEDVDVRLVQEHDHFFIHKLEQHYNEEVQDMRNHYDTLHQQGTQVMDRLEADIQIMSQIARINADRMETIHNENDMLMGPLTDLRHKVETIQSQIKDMNKNQSSLLQIQAKLIQTKNQIQRQREKYILLEEKYEKVKQEKEEYQQRLLCSC